MFYLDHGDKADKYDGTSLINEAAYIDRAIFNNVSRLSQIIEDQTFSQLIMPVEAATLTDDEYKADAYDTGTKRILLFSAAAALAPSFISPDAQQAELILQTIKDQINQLYNSLGLQSEVKDSSSAESGSAKEYSYSRLNASLSTKAERLEELEYKLIDALSGWMDFKLDMEIIYPESFDVKTLQQEILYAQELLLLEVSPTFQKELHKRIVVKALPKSSKAKIEKILKEVDKSSPFSIGENVVNPSKGNTISASNNGKDKNIAEKKSTGALGGKLKSEQNKISNL